MKQTRRNCKAKRLDEGGKNEKFQNNAACISSKWKACVRVRINFCLFFFTLLHLVCYFGNIYIESGASENRGAYHVHMHNLSIPYNGVRVLWRCTQHEIAGYYIRICRVYNDTIQCSISFICIPIAYA